MEAQAALAELLRLSSQVQTAVLLEEDRVLASTLRDQSRAGALADAGRELLARASELRPNAPGVLHAEVVTAGGDLYAIRGDGRTIVATAVPGGSSGLALYDLRTCLRNAQAS